MDTCRSPGSRVMGSIESHDRAAVQIQRVVRGFLGRLEALRRANVVYEKIYDPRSHRYYYYNTRTFETSWKPPAVVINALGQYGDMDNIAPTYTEDEAAVKLQAAWRRRRGIRIARTLLASIVTKVFDDTSGAFYYFNKLTGEASWSKPSLFGSKDLEDVLSETAFGEAQQSLEANPEEDSTIYYFEQSGASGGQQNQEHTWGAGYEGYEGYEGWVWDEYVGWYYDEEAAASQLGEGTDAGTPQNDGSTPLEERDPEGSRTTAVRESDSDDVEGLMDSMVKGGEGEDEEGRSRRLTLRRARRKYPRSKAQRLVDEAEDSLEGARPSLLDLSNLGMMRVTSRVYDLDWLERLDLSNNRLTRVSPDVACLTNLQDLDLRHNRLETIPDELEALVRLEHLRVGYNWIAGFRGNVYLISSLRTLDLGHNRMKEVPLQVGDLQLLKRTREWEIGLRFLREIEALDVSYNSLEKWPAQLGGCAKLRDLRLDHNLLREVPEDIGGNTSLTSLALGSNGISHLPAAINALSSLLSLDVSHNELEVADIQPMGRKEKGSRLASLATLRLARNRLPKAPIAVETLASLTELDLSHNPFEKWNPNLALLRKMKTLRLRETNLKRCPLGLGEMDKLEALDLADNRIQFLDRQMVNLFKLKTLELQGNRIQDLGPCVGSMISLTYLDARGNGLRVLPPQLSRCTALEYLDIGGGKLTMLHETLSKLTRLRCLRAQNQDLKEVPGCLARLTNLEELRLDGNKLVGLPSSLATLTKMRYATLSGNLMEAPPSVTREWSGLKHLVLSRNPLKLKSRQLQSRRLLQAAKLGQEAMHRGAWEEAVPHLEVAAEEYDNIVHNVPDFPAIEHGEAQGIIGKEVALCQTRPHDMDTSHHLNLGMASFQRAMQLVRDVEEMRNARGSAVASQDGADEKSDDSDTSEGDGDDASSASLTSSQREEERQKEKDLMVKREASRKHFQAATAACSYADRMEQLTRGPGRPVGVWLGKAAVAVRCGDPASAVFDLERAAAQLPGNSKVRTLLAKSRIELGQYDRGLTDCRVALRYLEEKERLLMRCAPTQEAKGPDSVRLCNDQAESSSNGHASSEPAAPVDVDSKGFTSSIPPTGGNEPVLGTEPLSGVLPAADDDATQTVDAVSGGAVMPLSDHVTVTPSVGEVESELQQSLGQEKTQSGSDPTSAGGIESPSGQESVGTARSRLLPEPSPRSLAHAKISSEREAIESVVAEGEEGLMLVQQSVDLARLKRAFVFNSYGVPVRDLGSDEDELLHGRGTFRDRYRRLQAVEGARSRARDYEDALTEKVLDQVSASQEDHRRVKARSEAILSKCREFQAECEREGEEEQPTGQGRKGDEKENPQESTTGVMPSPTSVEVDEKPPKAGAGEEIGKEDRDEEEDEDEEEEVKKVLAERARRRRISVNARRKSIGSGRASQGRGRRSIEGTGGKG